MLSPHYNEIFRTRSFRAQPLRTLARGACFEALRRSGATASFTCAFGLYRFRWRTKALPAGFGAGGFYIQRRYYEPLMEFGHRFLKAGDVAIDGGANQGIYTCAFAAAVGPTGSVLAFEPLDYAFSSLKANVALNGFVNCRLFHAALSDRDGSAVIDASVGPVCASITRDYGKAVTKAVETRCIDGLRLEQLDFVKLDVEGAEFQTLQGARQTLERFHPFVCAEANIEAEYRPVEALLSGLGYTPYIFDDDGNMAPMPEPFEVQSNVFFIPARRLRRRRTRGRSGEW
jgi:FkbM family methyltransferase